MLFKKSLSRTNLQTSSSLRLLLVLPLFPLLTSCTTTFIPGLDRVFFPNSSAKVGPLLTNDDEKVVAAADSQPAAKEVVDLPEPTSGTLPSQAPSVAKKPSPEDNASKPITASNTKTASPVSKPVKPKPPISKAKPKPATTAIAKTEPQPAVNASSDERQKTTQPAAEYGVVTGTVALIGERDKQLAAAGTMITFMPKNDVKGLRLSESKTHVIDMEDKIYLPRYSTINVGDQVVFVNKDNIRHNVFSSSGSNAFDLGTYGAGLKRAVTLEEPGIVKIYCNIHADMATFVAVANPGLSVQTDNQGRYQLSEVPPGNYDVIIWNIRGEKKRLVEVKANQTVKLVDSIDTTAFARESRQNKFGKNYSKNSTLFEDEFY